MTQERWGSDLSLSWLGADDLSFSIWVSHSASYVTSSALATVRATVEKENVRVGLVKRYLVSNYLNVQFKVVICFIVLIVCLFIAYFFCYWKRIRNPYLVEWHSFIITLWYPIKWVSYKDLEINPLKKWIL